MTAQNLPEPDFLLVRARDLKHILMMLDSAAELRKGRRDFRASHTERTAVGQLRNVANSSMSLCDFLKLAGQGALS